MIIYIYAFDYIMYMKKIEAIIKTESFPELRSLLEEEDVYSLSKHDIGGSMVSHRLGNRKGVFLSKVEIITQDKDSNKIINMIARFVDEDGKIFVSDLDEIIDARTFESKKDLEKGETKRSRLVPLQKYSMIRAEKFYDTYRDVLRTEYRIRSFSDFINYCVISYIPLLEEDIKHNTILKNR